MDTEPGSHARHIRRKIIFVRGGHAFLRGKRGIDTTNPTTTITNNHQAAAATTRNEGPVNSYIIIISIAVYEDKMLTRMVPSRGRHLQHINSHLPPPPSNLRRGFVSPQQPFHQSATLYLRGGGGGGEGGRGIWVKPGTNAPHRCA